MSVALVWICVLVALAGCGALLVWMGTAGENSDEALVEPINELLPQTQCAQCGYPGCRPYAEAIARGEVEINRCPPGGEQTLHQLADLLGREPLALDSSCGEVKPPQVALINEADCIGCALCLPACPVDAIAGAARFMHTVISADCTGCELCVAPCPVDCIELIAIDEKIANWQPPKPHPQGVRT